MASDNMIRGLFRALETSIHERLNMIEDVIRLTGSVGAEIPVTETQQETYSAPQDVERIRNLEDQIQTLSARLAALEQSGPATTSSQEVHVHQEGKGESLWIEPMRDLAIELPATTVPASKPTPEANPAPAPANSLVSVEEEAVEVKSEADVSDDEGDIPADHESVAVSEAEADAEEVEAEEEADADAEEADADAEEVAEEEEGVEIEEFEYKGKTYYRDGENQVYRMVNDELDETPIGTWDPERQRVLFRRPTSA